jgi:ubiquinone/menaquinone biosynthesis C-methylase UbiE
MEATHDNWSSGDPYEYFMGRWSKQMAPLFLQWLNVPFHKSWLDLGCGTGALSEAIANTCKPESLFCVDPSAAFLSKAKARNLQQSNFLVGSASDIPIAGDSVDIVVSALALNFFPDLTTAFSEMKRVLKPGGTIAAYVWDYSDKMQFLRLFWDAAREIDTEAYQLDEGNRFPLCHLETLQQTFENAGLSNVESHFLDVDTVFKNFDDYWNPFLGGQGPAPSYLASLTAEKQQELKSTLQKKLLVEPGSSIKLLARAIAVQGKLN